MEIKQLILLAFKVAIIGTMFGYGLKATVGDFRYLLHRPGLALRSFLSVFVIMPVLVIVVVKVFDLRTAVEATLVALAISPVPPLLPQKQTKAGGVASYALGLLILMAVVAIAAIPLWIGLLGYVFDRSFAVDPGAIARIVLIMIVLPLAAGMAVHALLPRVATRLELPVRCLSTGLLVLAALAMLAGTWGAVWNALGDGTAVALAGLVLVGLLVGHLLGGPAPEHSTVLALSSASRHPAIALSIASVNYPDEQFVGIVLLYLLISAVLCIPYVAWQRRRSLSAASS
jgi:BASS family bile acid:Na+ symporter